MGFPVTINGTTYNASDFAPYGYVDNFPRMMQDMADVAATTAAQAQRLIGTSTSSVPIGTGSKSFSTQAGKLFDAGGHLLITADGAPSTNFMLGRVTSYSGTSLTVDVVLIGEAAAGTYSAWTIRVTGYQGPQGVTGFTGASTPGADQFESRTAVAGATIASTGSGGPGYIRTAGYSAAGDGGHALYKRVGSLPSHSAYVQSTDGAYWELVPDGCEINILQVGGKADGTFNAATGTDNRTAFLAARSFIIAKKSSISGSYTLVVPKGIYYSSDYWEMKGCAFEIRGNGNGMSGGQGTVLQWPAGKHGIIIAGQNTLGGGTEAVSTGSGGDGSILSNFLMWSLGQGTNTWNHGIWMRGRTTVRDVQVAAFPFAGIYIRGSAGVPTTDPANFDTGNCNCWTLDNVTSYYNMFGVYVIGADSNAGKCIGGDFSHNYCWGVFDTSFLGNTWVGCHTTDNGVLGTTTTLRTQSHHNGKTWAVTSYHTDSAVLERVSASTTEPGTDNTVWTQLGVQASPSAEFPAWVSGTQHWQQGGSYAAVDVNNFTVFISCYSEGAQPAVQLAGRSMFLGGAFGSAVTIDSLRHVLDSGRWQGGIETQTQHVDGTFTSLTLGGSGVKINSLLAISHDTHLPGGLQWAYDPTNKDYAWTYGGGQEVARLTSIDTTTTASSGAAVPLSWMFPKLYIGGYEYRRLQTTDTVAPTTGSHGLGEIAFNIFHGSPGFATKGMVGWVCTAAGSPGTWLPFGEYGVYKERITNQDPASLAAGATTVLGSTITLTGATTSDYVQIIPIKDTQGIQVTGYVSASNTISIRLTNPTSGAIDLPSGQDFLAVLRKFPA